MTKPILNTMLVAGAAVAALSVAACSKPADTTTAAADNTANAMAPAATSEATNTAANTADNTAAPANAAQ
ncbi:MAG TPA: hypothetical protein VGF33_03330 [Caulobacteraceae bacterium]|jgi:hypothetical protein